ncbi:MAG TPA: chorismate synthase, partial [Bacteroidales bacterium]|nr:chorismate synthase [Bacteroidales bacterium]
MSANTFGKIFRLTTFGESHGAAVGGIVDGCPAGIEVDREYIQQQLNRRRPGQSGITSQRSEKEEIVILSGMFEGKTTGAPIAFMIRNEDARPSDYEQIRDIYRPSHADYTWDWKFGFRDWRGGGRSSARETVARVAGGAIAQLLLLKAGIKICAFVNQVGKIKLEKRYSELDLTQVDSNAVRCPDLKVAELMMKHLEEIKSLNDSTGGMVTCVIQGLPAGIGEPVFDKLHADLAKAMMSINAAKGFEYGEGFSAASMLGSEHNDSFSVKNESGFSTSTNHAGGILGGISTGADIYFNIAFKPIATIMQPQQTLNTKGEKVTLEPKG